MRELRIGSLFTGTGALDMAAREVLGGRTVWHSDIKPAAVRFLEERYPGVPNIGDLTRMFPATGPLRREALDIEPIDILTAGWPCQPHSPAGKRLGEADPRALWPNVRRAVATLRPRIFLGENVARVASNGELRRVARSLAEIGYVGAWRCVTASDIGAPHKRDRCFVVAVDADTDPARIGRWAERRDHRAWPAELVTGPDEGRLTLLKTPTAQLAVNGGSQHPDKRKAGGHGPTLADEVEWLLPTPALSDRFDRWGVYAAAIERWERVLGRRAPAPTQLGPRGGFQLAPPFIEWMMGLPEGWVSECPGLAERANGERNARLSMLGDGVVPQQAAYAYRALLAELVTAERAA